MSPARKNEPRNPGWRIEEKRREKKKESSAQPGARLETKSGKKEREERKNEKGCELGTLALI
jgi:hypothetical protein